VEAKSGIIDRDKYSAAPWIAFSPRHYGRFQHLLDFSP
jgi:hypothetical protein